jgi:hypothetical protein
MSFNGWSAGERRSAPRISTMEPKLRQLLDAVLQQTKAKQLEWDSFDENTFRVRVAPGSIHIRRVFEPAYDADGTEISPAEVFVVLVTNASVRVIQEVRITSDSPAYTRLQELFDVARDFVFNTDDVFDAMLANLGPAR